MSDYIKRENAIKVITRNHDEVLSVVEAIEDIESVPSTDVVTREQYEQIHWERDVALHQLEEIGKGLGEKMVDVVEIKKEGEWDMFDLISSAYYGKGMYFKQDNGTVYSRHSGKYMTVDEAIKEFISLIDEDVICVPSVTTVWGDGEAPTYVLQKKGKWELVSTTKLYESGLYVDDEIEEKCSLCGCHTFRYETQKENNFCPNCGAKMEEN